MKAIAISLDGALRKPLDVEAQDFGASLLYASLVDNFRIIVLGTDNPVMDEHFLISNGFTKYAKIAPERLEDAPTAAARKRMQLTRLRAEGFRFEFVIVPDPEMAIDLYRAGTPVMLYLHPLYSAESFRPDYSEGIRPWAELAEQVEYSRQKRAEERKKQEEQNV